MIVLPFPPSSLSGHNDKKWFQLAGVIKKHRQWAHTATLAAKPVVPDEGDIAITFRFVPPDRSPSRLPIRAADARGRRRL